MISIDFEASSFDGIPKSTLFGSVLVSTIAKIGIFNLFASWIAICSLLISTTNNAPGSLVIDVIDPRFFSSFALVLSTLNFSFLDKVSKVPSSLVLSIADIFFTAFLIVTKFVSIPPGHLSVMYGIFTSDADFEIISLACFLVATNKIFLPDDAIFSSAEHASSNLLIVLYKLIMWIPFFSE